MSRPLEIVSWTDFVLYGLDYQNLSIRKAMKSHLLEVRTFVKNNSKPHYLLKKVRLLSDICRQCGVSCYDHVIIEYRVDRYVLAGAMVLVSF